MNTSKEKIRSSLHQHCRLINNVGRVVLLKALDKWMKKNYVSDAPEETATMDMFREFLEYDLFMPFMEYAARRIEKDEDADELMHDASSGN